MCSQRSRTPTRVQGGQELERDRTATGQERSLARSSLTRPGWCRTVQPAFGTRDFCCSNPALTSEASRCREGGRTLPCCPPHPACPTCAHRSPLPSPRTEQNLLPGRSGLARGLDSSRLFQQHVQFRGRGFIPNHLPT